MEKYKSDYKKPKWTFHFYKNYRFVLIPEKWRVKEILWKDKVGTPRCEVSPYIRIE